MTSTTSITVQNILNCMMFIKMAPQMSIVHPQKLFGHTLSTLCDIINMVVAISRHTDKMALQMSIVHLENYLTTSPRLCVTSPKWSLAVHRTQTRWRHRCKFPPPIIQPRTLGFVYRHQDGRRRFTDFRYEGCQILKERQG